MPSPRVPILLAAAVLASGCFYDFKNPAEVLRAGEASGTLLAERTTPGVLEGFPGVSVSLKGSAFDQTTRASGRFAVLDLPVGRHTLLFRKDATWSLERDVEVAFGKDGQPEGVDLGEVVLKYASQVIGTVSLPAGTPLATGVAVDEVSGQTAMVVPDAPLASTGSYVFPALGVGAHAIKVALRDGLASGTWVGGPVAVTVEDVGAAESTTSAPPIAAKVAASQGRVRFRVQLVGDPGLTLADVTVTLVPDGGAGIVVTPDSQGFVDQTVPEGLYQVVLTATATPRHALLAASPAPARPLAGLPVSPPSAFGVVLGGRVAEVGSVYVVSDQSVAFSSRECRAATDCGTAIGGQSVSFECSGSQCFTCSGVVTAGPACTLLNPPPTPGAAIPFCPPCSQRAGCEAGPGVSSFCNPSGVCQPTCSGFAFSCTPDGVVTYTSNASGC